MPTKLEKTVIISAIGLFVTIGGPTIGFLIKSNSADAVHTTEIANLRQADDDLAIVDAQQGLAIANIATNATAIAVLETKFDNLDANLVRIWGTLNQIETMLRQQSAYRPAPMTDAQIADILQR